MSCKMSADKTKAVLSIGIKMFPFQISYVKNMHIKWNERGNSAHSSSAEGPVLRLYQLPITGSINAQVGQSGASEIRVNETGPQVLGLVVCWYWR